MTDSRRSPTKPSAERCGALVCAAALAAAIASFADDARTEEQLRPYAVVGDAIPQSLTGAKGDVERGRNIVVNRQVGLCLLCQSGPFPEEKFQGTLAPDLKGTGARWSEGSCGFGSWMQAASTRARSCRPITGSTVSRAW